jgi:hypothetical protein
MAEQAPSELVVHLKVYPAEVEAGVVREEHRALVGAGQCWYRGCSAAARSDADDHAVRIKLLVEPDLEAFMRSCCE